MRALTLVNPRPSRTVTSVYPTMRERWSAVAARQVYFGHQSVGGEIVTAIEHISEEMRLGIRVVQTTQPDAVRAPAFVHFQAGRNQDPASKNAALLKVLDARRIPDHAIVVLKYCYVDMQPNTNVRTLFDDYRALLEDIRRLHPDTVVVHSTMPLTTVETRFKARIKGLLGRRVARDGAIARHEYNARVRNEFAGRPLFDIAAVESRQVDGSPSYFMADGERIETLAAENTYDGGHLNTTGRRAAATALLDAVAHAIAIAR